MDFSIYLILIFLFMVILFYVINTYNLERKEFKINYPTALIDAFGRERVSIPFTLGDYDSLYDNHLDFIEHTEGTGNIVAVTNESCTKLSINGSGRAAYQSKMYHEYMPGKSQLILMTFRLGKTVKGVTKRVGYFDDNDGIFLEEDSNGVLSFNIRTSTSRTPVISETSKESEWNVFNIDRTKVQLLFIDFQWLGVGKVRCGFVYESKFVTCKIFYHTNITEKVYIRTPNLPLRYEITGNGVAEMFKFCGSVMSEGGYTEGGRDWSHVRASTLTGIGTGEVPIMAIRLKNQFKNYDNRMTVRLGNINVFSTENNIQYRVLKYINEDVIGGGGGAWSDVDNDSGVQYLETGFDTNVLSSANFDFYEIESGFVAGGGNNPNQAISSIANSPPSSAKQNFIAQNFDSTNSDVYLVAVKRITAGNNANVDVSMQWREIY